MVSTSSIRPQIEKALRGVQYLQGNGQRLRTGYQDCYDASQGTMTDVGNCGAPLAKACKDDGRTDVSGEGATVKKNLASLMDRLNRLESRCYLLTDTGNFTTQQYGSVYQDLQQAAALDDGNSEVTPFLQQALSCLENSGKDHQYAVRYLGWVQGKASQGQAFVAPYSNIVRVVCRDDADGTNVSGDAKVLSGMVSTATPYFQEQLTSAKTMLQCSDLSLGYLAETERQLQGALDHLTPDYIDDLTKS